MRNASLEQLVRGNKSSEKYKYNEIITAAVKLFNEKGYPSTSIRDIAALVGLTQGTIYHYFKTKEDILLEINLRVIDIAIDRVKKIRDLKCSCREKIHQNIREVFEVIANYKDFLAVFLKEYKSLSERNRKMILKKRASYERIFQSIIKEGIRKKEFKEMDVNMMSMAFLGMCNWATTWLNPNGRLSIEKIVDIFAEIFLDGISITPRSSNY